MSYASGQSVLFWPEVDESSISTTKATGRARRGSMALFLLMDWEGLEGRALPYQKLFFTLKNVVYTSKQHKTSATITTTTSTFGKVCPDAFSPSRTLYCDRHKVWKLGQLICGLTYFCFVLLILFYNNFSASPEREILLTRRGNEAKHKEI